MNSSPTTFHLGGLNVARAGLPPAEFRALLRRYLIDHPNITLRKVAEVLDMSRQRAGWLAGKLDRPNCAQTGPRPSTTFAAAHMAELWDRVAAGESAEKASKSLGISLPAALRLGFRSKAVRPPHGTWERARLGCNCWRCRQVSGLSVPRGPRAGEEQVAACLDWLAWADPDDGQGLSQAAIGRLSGVGQAVVSRIARAAGGAE